jgi:hypothetical protein
MSWQRSNVQAAAAYLRERIAAGVSDARTRSIYEGLLEVLDPNRRTARLQRELAESAKAAVTPQTGRDRRARSDRRAHGERRQGNVGAPAGTERRRGGDRRTGKDRRSSR